MNERIIKEQERRSWLLLGFGLLLALVLGLILLGPRPSSGQSTAAETSPVPANPVQPALPTSGIKPLPEQRIADSVILKLPTPADNAPPGSNAGPGAVLAVGQPAPAFTLKTLAGQEIRLADLLGQGVLLNFWASWCPPCRLEMPELIRAYETHRAHDLVVLGINVTSQDTLVEAGAFVEEFEVSYPTLLDETGEVTEKLYQVRGLPTSIFINREGLVTRIQLGAMSGSQIEEFVTEILE
jgi:peroxiredoxin